MNRLILIGNGFDLEHDLKTSYSDFLNEILCRIKKNIKSSLIIDDIDSLEKNFKADLNAKSKINHVYLNNDLFELNLDNLVIPHQKTTDSPYNRLIESLIGFLKNPQNGFRQLKSVKINYQNGNPKVRNAFIIKNKLLEKMFSLNPNSGWADIERHYYEELISTLTNNNSSIEDLNKDFREIIKMLEEYLFEQINKITIQKKETIKRKLFSKFNFRDFNSKGKEKLVGDYILFHASSEGNTLYSKYGIQRNIDESQRNKLLRDKVFNDVENLTFIPRKCHILNFNYTDLPVRADYIERNTLYKDDRLNYVVEATNIHGELNSTENPIIFGFGDELDSNYFELIEQDDKRYLDFIKSIRYSLTDKYNGLLQFLESDFFQVLIIGHSCDLSDRTLLNTIFEHENCCSIKIHYYQWKDEKSDKIHDDFEDKVKNIYRNFINKLKLRDRLVNKTFSSPLVPVERMPNSD